MAKRQPVSPLTIYRHRHNLNYEEAAQAAGISSSSWWRIEHFEVVPRPATARLLADFLKVPIIHLVRDIYSEVA